MEQDEFTLEYFCRLCAAEAALGVMLHPLFPPGDDDPKDELVRMIDVLTSVTLNRTQDSAAVVCDKCLQMLDLFCQFREECLRQDVMIRTRRELDKERRQEEAAAAAAAAASAPVCVEIKEEPDQDEPPTIVIDDCKDEPPEEEDDDDDDEDDEDREVQPCANQMAQQLLASSLVTNSSNSNSSSSFVTPAEISLYSQTSSLSISVQVNQISLDNMGTAALVAVPVIAPIPDQSQLPPAPPAQPTSISAASPSTSTTTFRKGKLDPNKPPPDCELCQESFATHYDYEQHLDQVHAWDRGTRCSLACDPCQMRFTKSYNLKRHMYEVHGELAPGLTVTACEYCGLKFLRGYTLNRHVAKMHSKRAKAKKMMILKSK